MIVKFVFPCIRSAPKKMKDFEELDQLLIEACSMAREAGAIHMRYFRTKNLEVHTKAGEADIVTAADREAEQCVINTIRSLHPDHSILSEESGEASGHSDWRWVIDPLDGTTNFNAGLPLFAVSIGLEYRGETVIGVVYAPRLDELFTAIRGEGAYLNGTRITVSSNDRIDRAVVATGFPVDKNENPDNNLDNVARIMPEVRGLRRLGSAAIDLCYVAAGYLDAYWEMNLHQWDVSAGNLIVREAGGVVSSFREDRNVSIIAGSPAIHDIILPQILH